jgi:hypothetical protein
VNDRPAIIIQGSAQAIPSPAQDLEAGKICLPHLINKTSRHLELMGSLHQYMLRSGYQSIFSKDPENIGFKYKNGSLIRDPVSQFTEGKLRKLQGDVYNHFPMLFRYLVPLPSVIIKRRLQTDESLFQISAIEYSPLRASMRSEYL